MRLYYPYSENKGADQLRGHREADLRLCFRICKKPVFSYRGSIKPYTSIFPWVFEVLILYQVHSDCSNFQNSFSYIIFVNKFDF